MRPPPTLNDHLDGDYIDELIIRYISWECTTMSCLLRYIFLGRKSYMYPNFSVALKYYFTFIQIVTMY
jgi:hypothetical protein